MTGAWLPFCVTPPRGAAALHTLFGRGLFYVLHLFADLFDLVFQGKTRRGDL